MRRRALLSARRLLAAIGNGLVRASEAVPSPILKGRVIGPSASELLQRNRKFRNIHAGRRAFVIGNGPSLRGVDLSKLAGEITLATNSFFLHPALDTWNPTYYCLIDPAFFEDSEASRDYFQQLQTRARKSIFLLALFFFRPLASAHLAQDKGFLPFDRTYFLALDGDIALPRMSGVDLTRLLPPVLNVVQACILCALYMGCSEIVLLGVDHDWLARPSENSHFYDKATTLENAITSNWTPPPSPYKYQIEVQIQVWRAYEQMADLAARRGVRVVNGTPDSYLDVFENASEVLARR